MGFVTSTKINLKVKVNLSASFWRDSFSGPKRERGIMHSVCRTEHLYLNTANSRKVVLREAKIQITKCKIQEKVCHITHMSELLTTSP